MRDLPRSRVLYGAVTAAMLLLPPAARAQRAPAGDTAVERRIRAVMSGLLVETAQDDSFERASLQDRMAYYHTPGVSIAVVDGYRVEWARGFGVREADRPGKVDANTRFQAGSVSKPTFAVVVMRLAEAGRLSLDDDVDGYLTSWRIPPVGDWRPRVTLRQLLTHSAGFTVHGFLGYARSQPVPTVPQLLDGLPPANSAPVRMNILPGLQVRYSGGGLTVAQLAVTDHVGEPLPQLARRLVFAPLGMTRSGYDQPLRDTADVAPGHYWMARPLPGRWHTYPELAAAGLWTTPGDLARLGASLQHALRGDSNEILSPQSARAMVTDQRLAGGSIGISFFLEGQGDSARIEHGGWDEGFLTEFVMYVRGGRGAVVMVNSTEGGDLINEIVRSIAREYGWPGYIGAPPAAAALAASRAADAAGTYTLATGAPVTVEDRSGELWLTLPDEPPVHLVPTSDSTFVVPGLNVRATVSAADSSARVLLLRQSGTTVRAERRPRPAARPD